MKHIVVVTPCYNEEDNVRELSAHVAQVFSSLKDRYTYEHLFIDNASQDRTQSILREMTSQDPRIKAIFNQGNFGHIRSPFHALLQCQGDATVLMAADFQDPPAMILDFLREWEAGHKVVMAMKTASRESPLMFWIRTAYYNFVNRLSNIELTKNTTGFGLYDREVIEQLRRIRDPYPYFRGLISELGYKPSILEFNQPSRKRGITKNNFYTLYDIAMLGITNHSKVPLRVATVAGFFMSGVSLFLAVAFFIAKLVFWSQFNLGTAPILIGLFFFSSVQLFFIGIIGEYIGSIHTQVLNRPLVVERERIGFK